MTNVEGSHQRDGATRSSWCEEVTEEVDWVAIAAAVELEEAEAEAAAVEEAVASAARSIKRKRPHDSTTSRLRGQGYDGASNMRGELNGLKKLVLDVNLYAFYVHCFAHQLQLVVVAVVKEVLAVSDFFGNTNNIVNMAS